MNRRLLLKVAGLAGIAGAVVTLPRIAERQTAMVASGPDGTRLTIREPGTYRISGRVRLDAPLVEISGIAHAQQMSWSGLGGMTQPVASFSTFESFDGQDMTRTIRVRGGRLEGVTAVPMDLS